jgi:hypothetical protein
MALTVKNKNTKPIMVSLTPNLCTNTNLIVLSYLSVDEVYKLKENVNIDIIAWCKMVKDIGI